MATPYDADDPMGDAETDFNTHQTRETDPGGWSQKGKEKRMRSKPPSSDTNKERKWSRCLPSPGELQAWVRANRQSTRGERQRRDGIGTSAYTTSSWRSDEHGNLVHRGQCNVCQDYALHVYGHALDEDLELLDTRDHRNKELTHSLRVKYDRVFDEYKDDISRLKGSIRALEDELDHAKGLLDKQKTKRA